MTDSPVIPEANDTTQGICPLCHGAGYVRLKVSVGHPQFGKAVLCVCQRNRIRTQRLASLRQVSNLQHMQGMTCDTFQTDGHGAMVVAMALQDALNTAREYAAKPSGWLVFTGTYGCGKTHLAAAIANYRVEHGLPVLFVIVPDLLDYLRATYAPNSPVTYDERFDQVRNVELLVLDDLGTQNATPWAEEKLYQILNYRYNAKLPTVITTNQTLQEMDPRLSSRFRDQDLVHTMPIYTPDYRTKGKTESFGSIGGYSGMNFSTFSDRRDELEPQRATALRQATKRVEEYAENPSGWLVLCGDYGVGKTHLAAAAANKISNMGMSVLFVVVPDLLDHLRATFQPGSAVSYDQRFNEVRQARLLVLDDLGTQNTTPWAREKLFQILNFRYVAGLATIITVSKGAWDQLDERLKSRMFDTKVCKLLDIEVPVYRGNQSKAKQPQPSTRRRE